MKIVKEESQKKLKEILEGFEKPDSLKSENWKSIIDQNKEKFKKIKTKIKEKQAELTALVRRKKAINISVEEFNEKSKELQGELYDLESKILKLRLQNIT